jgi:hypothetical protein
VSGQTVPVEFWGDGNPKVLGESFDDYNARMMEGLRNLGEPLARNADGTLDTEAPCWCDSVIAKHLPCPRHLGWER